MLNNKQHRPERVVVLIALGVALIALEALAAWQIGDVPLAAMIAGSVALQPTTAVVLIIGALALTAAAAGWRWASRVAGVVLLAACGAWLWADVVQRPLPIDLLFYRSRVLAQHPQPQWPGRPSIITCIVMALFAASLLGVGLVDRRLRLAALGVASVGALLASLSVMPYFLNDFSKLSILNLNLRIALNTAVAVGALCIGVLILMRDTGWAHVLVGDGERARIARLLAPIALVPVAFGSIANLGVRGGLYGPDVRMLINVELSACTMLFLAFWAAQMLGRERRGRDSLANALERSTVVVCGSDGTIRHWSRACEKLFGWSATEAVGRPISELLNIENPENRQAIRETLWREGEWRSEIRLRTPGGDLRWLATHWVLQAGDTEEEARLVGTVNDITDLKLAEASLRASQERLTLAMEAYGIGIFDVHLVADDRHLHAEEGMERLLGVPPGGVNGSSKIFRSMMVFEGPEQAGRVNYAIEAGLPEQAGDMRIRRPDGEIRDLSGIRRFFYSPEGAYERTIGVFRDVTEERRAQGELALRGDRLAELRAELAHVGRLSAMGEMAAALAHELNQPLTAIGNSVGALKIMLADGGRTLDEVARARVVRAADQAEGQAVRAGEIVRRLRDFIARGEADARIEPLQPMVEDSVALAAPNATSEGIDIRLELSPKARLVLADRIQIQQILVNLIRNALEAMRGREDRHLLTISAMPRKGMAEIAVKDNGPGLAPHLTERLFSPFQSTKDDGMGVGLSICRRIVEAHGGRLWLEESTDGGADFRFTIPLASKELRHAQ